MRFILIDGNLYKRGFSSPLLKCLNPDKANYILREVHEGSCGNHSGAQSLARKVLRQGYYWAYDGEGCLFPSAKMLTLPETHKLPAQPRCLHEDFGELVPIRHVGNGHSGKIALRNRTKRIFDSGCRLLHQVGRGRAIGENRREGSNEIHLAKHHLPIRVLWAYRTTPMESAQETPFNLVHGAEAVLPAEIGEESWRIRSYDNQRNSELRREDLDLIEENREATRRRICIYKSKMAKAYDSKVRPRKFEVGDLVLRKTENT
ncbi:UNVERIFIED_CONTAM: hypothetical protein Sradi_2943900 [Sesamum radiatum]|uniref:Uncharacterized protein n=1 Tax=Sesamum radiatum TaxID=300843 RepID=A0AAW2S166_SESRA